MHMENVEHLLLECDWILRLWQQIQNIVSKAFDIHMRVDLVCVCLMW